MPVVKNDVRVDVDEKIMGWAGEFSILGGWRRCGGRHGSSFFEVGAPWGSRGPGLGRGQGQGQGQAKARARARDLRRPPARPGVNFAPKNRKK